MSQTNIPTTPPESQPPDGFDRFIEASGCLHIIRSFRMAIEPRVLAIALVAIIATFLLGIVLDAIYLGMGGGVPLDAIDRFIENPSAVALESDAASPSMASKEGGDADVASERAAGGSIKKRRSAPARSSSTGQQRRERASDKDRADRNQSATPPTSVAPSDAGVLGGAAGTKDQTPTSAAGSEPSSSSAQPKKEAGEERSARTDQAKAAQPPAGGQATHGVFEVWRKHERSAVLGLLTSSIPGTSVAHGSPVARHYVEEHTRFSPVQNLARIHGGVWWFLQFHPVYFFVFFLTGLGIWSICGGAICRIAAVQFAREEKITHRQALAYAWEKRTALFFAPCVPVAFLAVVALGIMLIGMVIRLPVLDVLAVVLLPLSVFLGGLITWLGIGLAVGGSLFWPAVATDGIGAFDAFGRAFQYTLPRPWKTIQYAIITLLYAGFCCVFVNLFILVTLWMTRALTGIGGSWFGAWPRAGGSKMDVLWPAGGDALYTWPADVSWHEYPAAVFVGLTVLLVIGILWSFLASLFFSSSTIGYFLLRRDVDGTDLSEIHWEDDDSDDPGFEPTAAVEPAGGDIPLPTIPETPDPDQS